MTKIAIVLLNWNGIELLQEFLPAVVKYSQIPEAKLFVADNGSTDQSLNYIKENYPEVGIIELGNNYGFTGGYNKALQRINAEYFLLLNTDVAPSQNWLPPLLETMENDPDVAICVPKIKSYKNPEYFEYAGAAGGYIDKYGFPYCKGRIFDHLEKDEGQYNETADILWASGAALMIRAELYTHSGGLDEDFFAHMEEIDLCWRLKNQGWKIRYVYNSEVYHLGGGTLNYKNPRKVFFNFRNNLYLLTKNLPKGQFAINLLKRLILDGIAGLKFLMAFEFSNFLSVLKAHFSFYISFGKMYKKRKVLLKQQKVSAHPEIYSKAIILQYFIKNKKKYSELPK